MNHRSITWSSIICAAVAAVGVVNLANGQPESAGQPNPPRERNGESRLSLASAKDRADVMHQVYSATLDVMHRHYFHANKSVLPARAMEDVFTDVAKGTQSTARWMSVNTKPMSVDHEPKTDFERQAARAIAAGKSEVTIVEDGYFRRAGAIPLTAGCIACHTGFSNNPGTAPRYAALIISIPVRDEPF